MKRTTKSNWEKQLPIVSFAVFVLLFVGSLNAFAQGKFKVGEVIEAQNHNGS